MAFADDLGMGLFGKLLIGFFELLLSPISFFTGPIVKPLLGWLGDILTPRGGNTPPTVPVTSATPPPAPAVASSAPAATPPAPPQQNQTPPAPDKPLTPAFSSAAQTSPASPEPVQPASRPNPAEYAAKHLQATRERERAAAPPQSPVVLDGQRAKLMNKHAELYIPKNFKPNDDGTYNVVYHFFGAAKLQEENIERANVNTVVVSVNLGNGSDAYSNGFKDKQTFKDLMAETDEAMKGKAAGGAGHVALSAWSAGYAAVGRILTQPGMADRVDTVILADGLHTARVNGNDVEAPAIKKYADFAERAKRGEKTFIFTHSSIETPRNDAAYQAALARGEKPPTPFASTSETAAELLRQTGVEARDVSVAGPRGMQQISTADSGNFHVMGYAGKTAKDHIDQVKAMGELEFSYLAKAWGPTRSGPSTPAPADTARRAQPALVN